MRDRPEPDFRLRFPALALPDLVLPTVNADRWCRRPATRALRGIGEALQRAHTGMAHRYIIWQVIGALVLITMLFVERS